MGSTQIQTNREAEARMSGTVTRIGTGFAEIRADDGRKFLVYAASFAVCRPNEHPRLRTGDVVEFQPGGKGGEFACNLTLTPYVREPSHMGPGRLYWRDKLTPRGGPYDGYVWSNIRRGALVEQPGQPAVTGE